MTELAIDTPGYVAMGAEHNRAAGRDLAGINWVWSDFRPFEQGYVEALLKGVLINLPYQPGFSGRPAVFSDLAPASIARILADCEAWRAEFTGKTREASADRHDMGAEFWRIRQEGKRRTFPPLAFALSDHGWVQLRRADCAFADGCAFDHKPPPGIVVEVCGACMIDGRA